MIVLAIVANIVFQLILRYRPDLLPAEMREAIDKAKADAETRKAARNR